MRAGATAAASARMATAGSVPAAMRTSQWPSGSRSDATKGSARSGARSRSRIERLEEHPLGIELSPQFRGGFIEHDASLVDHHHLVAQLLGLRHHMRGQQDGRAAAALIGDERS